MTEADMKASMSPAESNIEHRMDRFEDRVERKLERIEDKLDARFNVLAWLSGGFGLVIVLLQVLSALDVI